MKKMLLVLVLAVSFLLGSISLSMAQTKAQPTIDKVKEKKFLAIQKA